MIDGQQTLSVVDEQGFVLFSRSWGFPPKIGERIIFGAIVLTVVGIDDKRILVRRENQ